MKKIFLTAAAMVVAWVAAAQVTVTVVPAVGSPTDIAMDGTGEIYVNTTNLIIMSSTQNGQTVSFDLADVSKVLFSGSTGISEIRRAGELKVYPNPAAESVTVEGLDADVRQMVLYNAAGVMVREWNAGNGATVSTDGLAAGVYLMRAGDKFARLMVK